MVNFYLLLLKIQFLIMGNSIKTVEKIFKKKIWNLMKMKKKKIKKKIRKIIKKIKMTI